MSSRIRPASRSQAKPLIGLYSESGCGKTYSALLLARGFVGSSGRICMIETESGRGESYGDKNEYPEIGGYDVLSLRDNFSPIEYGKAISEVEAGKYNALIIDSASHEWEGAGGVLDQASENAKTKKGLLVWQEPKINHQKHFMLKFMQTPIPLVILCMRAKYPMVEVWNEEKRKKEPQRSKELEPKQSEDILFEMFVHAWVDKSHALHPTKITGKGLNSVFKEGEKITLSTGQQLAEWAKSSSTIPVEKTPEQLMAARIGQAIKLETTIEGLSNIFEVDFKDDLETIKKASATAYQYLVDLAEARKSAIASE